MRMYPAEWSGQVNGRWCVYGARMRYEFGGGGGSYREGPSRGREGESRERVVGRVAGSEAGWCREMKRAGKGVEGVGSRAVRGEGPVQPGYRCCMAEVS